MIKLLNRMENSKSALSLQLFPKCLLWPLVIVSIPLQKIYCGLYNVFNCKMAFKWSPVLRLAKWLWAGKRGWIGALLSYYVLWGCNRDENFKNLLARSGTFNHKRNKKTNSNKGKGKWLPKLTQGEQVWSPKEQRPPSSRESAHCFIYPKASS